MDILKILCNNLDNKNIESIGNNFDLSYINGKSYWHKEFESINIAGFDLHNKNSLGEKLYELITYSNKFYYEHKYNVKIVFRKSKSYSIPITGGGETKKKEDYLLDIWIQKCGECFSCGNQIEDTVGFNLENIERVMELLKLLEKDELKISKLDSYKDTIEVIKHYIW